MTSTRMEGWQTITDLNRWHHFVNNIEHRLRPVFRRFSKLGGPAYFDNKDFPITQKLEENYFLIRGEFDRVRKRLQDFPLFQDISPEQVYISNDDKWRMFFLKANNVRFDRNCELFPKTMEIVDSDKNLVSAYFSILDSNKMLVPHEGPWSGGAENAPWCRYTHRRKRMRVVCDGQGVSMEERQGRCVRRYLRAFCDQPDRQRQGGLVY